MGDYDFTGLSTRSFEKLTQALAVRILGPGTIVFGDGPDGGREATYEGHVNFPSSAAEEQWDGYIVLQAKFRQRLTEKTADSDWAVGHLREELKKFVARKGGRRAPEYYIFITNAVLSPVQETGGKDRAAEVFAEFAKELPLRGWAIWDYDQLATFIDTEESIRHAFAAFITPGDVLAEVIKRLKPIRQDFVEVITNYLAQEMNAAKYANLEQTSASRILLSRVFTDLPISEQRLADPPDESGKRLDGVVSMLIESARDVFDPETTLRSNAESPAARYVLVGGPGQGKTTVGQFACQLFRAAILKDRPAHLLAPEIANVLEETQKVCAAEGIDLPSARRFPLHVVLSEFATAVSRRRTAIVNGQPLGELTLFAYLVEKIRTRTNRDVTNDDFRAWLGAYPWLLVLDGLDEVPSSSNRADILQKIEDFWIEAAQANADLLVVATTRPQDYHDDFSPRYYRHRWLVPLSPERALEYGGRLVGMRHSENVDRAEQLTDRLRDAASSEATARLMRTPLQVTIMATLVEQVGRPPQDRWRLFDEYYGAIYRRERERTQSELLGRHQSDIDAIHYRTGLELQIASEASGGTDARLSAKHFETIVRQRLENQGHEGTALELLVKEIVEAAAFRLVFIVGLDVDSVGFEIRSLQEFMAAEALLSGETLIVQKRLRAIAGVPSWRNVFVFAAGRCFAETESLIDTLHAICQELNGEGSEGQRAIQAGSNLALELLEDAAVAPKPKHARLLARMALLLLDAPPTDVHMRLAGVCTSTVEPVFREELEGRLKDGNVEEQLGAWMLVGHLMDRTTWAKALGSEYWPSDLQAQLMIITSADPIIENDWFVARAKECLPKIDPSALEPSERNVLVTLATDDGSWLSDIINGHDVDRGRASLRLTEDRGSPFALSYAPVERFERTDWPQWPDVADQHPVWRPFTIAARHQGPLDAHRVAAILDEIADSDSDLSIAMWVFPWPLGAAIEDSAPEALRATSGRLRSGELGDRQKWFDAQDRWSDGDIGLDELRALDKPWPVSIDVRGFPYQTFGFSINHGRDVELFALECARWFEEESDPLLKAAMARWLLFVVRSDLIEDAESNTSLPLDTLLDAASQYEIWISPQLASFALAHGRTATAQFMEELGRCPRLYQDEILPDTILFACSALTEDAALLGIAHVIAMGISEVAISDVRHQFPSLELPNSAPVHIRASVATLMALSIERQAISPAELAKIIAVEFPSVAKRTAELITMPYRSVDEALLVALSRELRPESWLERRSVRRTLENVLRSKLGSPRDAFFWRELGFADLRTV
jgi:hypothetical protein